MASLSVRDLDPLRVDVPAPGAVRCLVPRCLVHGLKQGFGRLE
ncbi:hypothetical protein [Embleya sp. NBC_00896]|nr:hypothetical protein OG928_46180 [Embleya sp. NBC_00896]